MKSVEHSKLGDPSQVLEITDTISQPLKRGEVRVSVLSTPIHPSNLLQISGQYGVAPHLPSVPGSEGVGRVVETGEGVEQSLNGQLVLLAGGGTWRQEMVGLAESFIALPEAADIEQLSMLTVNPLTALLILNDFIDLKPGDWIIQSAANSAVGQFIIQLAKKRGVKTINLVRRDSLIPELEAIGADVVLVDGPDLPQRVSTATEGAAISFAIDCVGGETFSRLIECLTFGGTIVAYGSLSMQPPALNSVAIIFNDVRVRGFWLSKWFETATPEQRQAAFGEIISAVAQGTLKAKVDSRYSLEEIGAAVTRAAEGGRDGKVLLIPNPA